MKTLKEYQEEGKKAVGSKNYAQALECYANAVRDYPDTSFFWSNRSQVNIKLGNFDDALDDADKSIQLDSKNIKGYYRKMSSLKQLSRFKEAKDIYLETIKMNKSEPDQKSFKDLLILLPREESLEYILSDWENQLLNHPRLQRFYKETDLEEALRYIVNHPNDDYSKKLLNNPRVAMVYACCNNASDDELEKIEEKLNELPCYCSSSSLNQPEDIPLITLPTNDNSLDNSNDKNNLTEKKETQKNYLCRYIERLENDIKKEEEKRKKRGINNNNNNSITSELNSAKSLLEKENTNILFKEKNYEEAIKKYTNALTLSHDHIIIYNNIALCHMRIAEEENEKNNKDEAKKRYLMAREACLNALGNDFSPITLLSNYYSSSSSSTTSSSSSSSSSSSNYSYLSLLPCHSFTTPIPLDQLSRALNRLSLIEKNLEEKEKELISLECSLLIYRSSETLDKINKLAPYLEMKAEKEGRIGKKEKNESWERRTLSLVKSYVEKESQVKKKDKEVKGKPKVDKEFEKKTLKQLNEYLKRYNKEEDERKKKEKEEKEKAEKEKAEKEKAEKSKEEKEEEKKIENNKEEEEEEEGDDDDIDDDDDDELLNLKQKRKINERQAENEEMTEEEGKIEMTEEDIKLEEEKQERIKKAREEIKNEGEKEIELGKKSEEEGKIEEALQHYDSALSYLSNDLSLLLSHADCLSKLERVDEALADIERAISLSPRDASIFIKKGYLHIKKKDFQSALNSFNIATRIDPMNTKAMNGKSIATQEFQKMLFESVACEKKS